MLPKLVISDIDGVWTDGGMYYDQTGNELKKFNTSDSAGVLFLKLLKIPLAIITGEETQIVDRRLRKLNVDYIFMGVKNKIEVATKMCNQLGVSFADVAYIGDDINDLLLLRAVGLSASPANAPSYIKKMADVVIETKGGDGAFRAFVEYILKANNLMDATLEMYLEQMRELRQ